MTTLPHTTRQFALSYGTDPRAFVGKVTSITPPSFMLITVPYMSGAMSGVVEIPTGRLEATNWDFILQETNPTFLGTLGLQIETLSFISHEQAADNDNAVNITYIVTGLFKTYEPSTWSAGDISTVRIMGNSRRSEVYIDGNMTLLHDPVEGILQVLDTTTGTLRDVTFGFNQTLFNS